MNILEYKFTDSRTYVRYEDDGEEKWWCLSAHVLTEAAPESSEVLMSASDVVKEHSPILGMHLPANVIADHLRKHPSASFSKDYLQSIGEKKRFENIVLAVCGGLLFGQAGLGLVAGLRDKAHTKGVGDGAY